MKVISKGKLYRVMCDNCGATLEYTNRDVDSYGNIECPECKNTIPHTRENEYAK